MVVHPTIHALLGPPEFDLRDDPRGGEVAEVRPPEKLRGFLRGVRSHLTNSYVH
jgi:hypothetical protein